MKKFFPFAIFKYLDLVLLAAPFWGCWQFYYEHHVFAGASSLSTTLLLMAFFLILCFYISIRMDCFQVSIIQIRDIIFGQFLALGITDLAMYAIIWMLSDSVPNLLPGLACFVTQVLISAGWAVIMHKAYFAVHPPMPTAVIYDERRGLENLISTYGMQKRFDIRVSYHVTEIMDRLQMLDDMEAVFLVNISSRERDVIIKYCTDHRIKMYMIPCIADVLMRSSQPLHMLHLPVLKYQRYKPSTSYLVVKRLIDILVSLLGIVILSPIFLVTALAVKADGGPALYKQKRLTKDNKVFEILKFRSMRVDAEKYSGAVLSAGESDPRITKVGRIIRAFRLDELPQLINILKGDMTLVGPRPERPELQVQIEKEVPEYGLRLQTKAGLTGYAQVYGKYNTTFYDKLLMDLIYIATPSLLNDLTIMLATVRIIFSKESTEGVGENAAGLSQPDHREEK